MEKRDHLGDLEIGGNNRMDKRDHLGDLKIGGNNRMDKTGHLGDLEIGGNNRMDLKLKGGGVDCICLFQDREEIIKLPVS